MPMLIFAMLLGWFATIIAAITLIPFFAIISLLIFARFAFRFLSPC